jgi:hypothetical protein
MAKRQGTAADIDELLDLVAQLPLLRAEARAQAERDTWAKGENAYARVCELYRRELPWTQQTATTLLLAAAHDCGHGDDVQPPIDIARTLLIDHGPDEGLIRAVEAYTEGLRGTTSVTAQRTKGIAGLLLLLDDTRPSSVGAVLSGPRGAAWRKLLAVVNHNGGAAQRAEVSRVAALVAEIGPARVIADVEALLPCSSSISVAESQVWKYLVVAVGQAAAHEAALSGRADAIVSALTRTAWKKPDVAHKIMHERAVYFASREDALAELTRIEAWFDALPKRKNEPAPPSKVRDLVEAYRRRRAPPGG